MQKGTRRAGTMAGPARRVWLERVAKRELNVAPVTALAGAPTEVRAGDVAVRPAQVRMIREVENLDAELHLVRIRDREILEERDVPLLIAGVVQIVARRVPEPVGADRHLGEGRRV